jgi:dGTPase
MHTTRQAQQVVRDLFAAYFQSPQDMPESFQARAARLGDAADDASAYARVVADYIAGMTDRFAGREHERLTGQQLLA